MRQYRDATHWSDGRTPAALQQVPPLCSPKHRTAHAARSSVMLANAAPSASLSKRVYAIAAVQVDEQLFDQAPDEPKPVAVTDPLPTATSSGAEAGKAASAGSRFSYETLNAVRVCPPPSLRMLGVAQLVNVRHAGLFMHAVPALLACAHMCLCVCVRACVHVCVHVGLLSCPQHVHQLICQVAQRLKH